MRSSGSHKKVSNSCNFHFLFASGYNHALHFEAALGLGTDHFIFEGGGRGWKYEKKNNSCTAFTEEIKIVHSGAKQRNILEVSKIKFIQSF